MAGYVPLEGRFSMVRTAHSIHDAAQGLLRPGESVRLMARDPANPGGACRLHVKLDKRLLHPLRLSLSGHDVLHLVDNDYAVGVPSWRWSRTVVTVHDLMPLWIGERLEDVFSSRMGRWFYRRGLSNLGKAGCVACVSGFTRRAVLEHTGVPEERIRVVPQGVGEAFQPCAPDDPGLLAFRREHGLEGHRIMLHVGTCAPYKRVDAVLALFARLRDSGMDDLRLLKIGGVFDEEQRRLIAAHWLEESLVHLQGLDEAGLVHAYNVASVLLWPSLVEGFGLPVLEAMACGTPVVCSDGGALSETAGHAALKHAPDDWDGLEASCRNVLQDTSVADEWRTRGLAWAGRFSWRETARHYLEIYRELMEEG